MVRGDIYYACLRYTNGHEERGYRPVLIISNDIGNQHSPTVIIAPITTKPKKISTHVCIKEPLWRWSIVQTEQIMVLDKERLFEYIGHLSDDDMRRVDHCIRISLALQEGKND